MNQQPFVFGARPVARKSDPWTSWAAAESVTDVTSKQAAVLWVLRIYAQAFRHMGLTDSELLHYYREAQTTGTTMGATLPTQSDSGLRTRRKELVRKGYVFDSGQRRRLASGRLAIIWSPFQ